MAPMLVAANMGNDGFTHIGHKTRNPVAGLNAHIP